MTVKPLKNEESMSLTTIASMKVNGKTLQDHTRGMGKVFKYGMTEVSMRDSGSMIEQMEMDD
jgi:hypothetical protein